MTRVLAVDAGRTSCRLAVRERGREEHGLVVEAGHTLADPDGTERVRDLIAEAVARLGPAAEGCSHLVAGFAGIWGHRAALEATARQLGEVLDVPELVLTNDVVTAHAGALALGPGVVLSAGTGAVALGVGDDGTVARVDGWGFLAGDAGSGYWVGRRGYELVLRAHDGRGRPTALTDRARARHGDLEHLHAALAGADSPARTVAAFARDVVEAAREGDAVASDIVDDAVAELVTTVAAAARRAHHGVDIPVAAVGGLLAPDGVLADRFATALARELPTARLQPPDGDALAGAEALAVDARHFEPFVHRRRR